jgi:hypothetical protein
MCTKFKSINMLKHYNIKYRILIGNQNLAPKLFLHCIPSYVDFNIGIDIWYDICSILKI